MHFIYFTGYYEIKPRRIRAKEPPIFSVGSVAKENGADFGTVRLGLGRAILHSYLDLDSLHILVHS